MTDPTPPTTWETPARLRQCSIHGQQPPLAWACPDCMREARQVLTEVARLDEVIGKTTVDQVRQLAARARALLFKPTQEPTP